MAHSSVRLSNRSRSMDVYWLGFAANKRIELEKGMKDRKTSGGFTQLLNFIHRLSIEVS